jgi:hypothetical protein
LATNTGARKAENYPADFFGVSSFGSVEQSSASNLIPGKEIEFIYHALLPSSTGLLLAFRLINLLAFFD